jgi:hypothetical protein
LVPEEIRGSCGRANSDHDRLSRDLWTSVTEGQYKERETRGTDRGSSELVMGEDLALLGPLGVLARRFTLIKHPKLMEICRECRFPWEVCLNLVRPFIRFSGDEFN